ncbi:unnamed protein product [Schistosoma margrebowiei]|uniref:Uncharacterized protein n=1 Tax=Schistosoma margrebowiei TaxID=48269 RepID=A0A183LEK3_9TREM|nr:unnamed protein product [Schistosoma margrebowiei]
MNHQKNIGLVNVNIIGRIHRILQNTFVVHKKWYNLMFMHFLEGVGYANVEHMVPVNENTVFRIASISKPFTSLLVGRLLDQHKLDLDEDIRSYLPEFPEKIVNGTYVLHLKHMFYTSMGKHVFLLLLLSSFHNCN